MEEPAGHAAADEQGRGAVMPVRGQQKPAGQTSQSANKGQREVRAWPKQNACGCKDVRMDPAVEEKEPAVQGKGRIMPAKGHCVPAGHTLHDVDPDCDANVPAGQALHADDPGTDV